MTATDADCWEGVAADPTECPHCGRESCAGDCQEGESEASIRSPEEERERRIAFEMEREEARREARRRLDARERGRHEEPAGLLLTDYLSEPDDPLHERIAGLQPRDARVMLVSQFKAGKTTLRDNLVRSLADGEDFLGKFRVTPPCGRVAILDLEMSRRQMKRWLRDQGIRNTDRVVVFPLRGLATAFDIRDRDVRAAWAKRLRDLSVSYPILDCVRPVLDALGLDEHHDAGVFLVAFDALLDEAGITEALVIHHMGHNGERARGDSRLIDWPDATWRLVRQDDNPASPRFLTAYGRDVDIPESRLDFDPTTRHLIISGGSRQDEDAEAALPDVLAVLRAAEAPLSVRGTQAALAESEHSRAAIRAALRLGTLRGQILTRKGKKGATLHECA